MNETINEVKNVEALYRRVLVPVDFSPKCHRALAVALDWQRRYGSEVYVLHLAGFDQDDEFLAGLGSMPHSDYIIHDAEERLKRFAEIVEAGASARVQGVV